MIKAATVGVHDHKLHIAKPGGSSRNLMSKAAPKDRQSTRTAKIAALLVSASFVNIPKTPSLLAEEPARRSCLTAGSKLGSWPGSRRGQVAVSPSYATFLGGQIRSVPKS